MAVMELLTISSFIVGILGSGFGWYMFQSKKKDEEEREELEEAADELNKLKKIMGSVHSAIENPPSDEDLNSNLEMIARDVIVYSFFTGEPAKLEMDIGMGETKPTEKEDILREYKDENSWYSINVGVEPEKERYDANYQWEISSGLHNTGWLYESLEKIQDDHLGIIESFEPGLQENIESTADDLVLGIHTNLLEMSGSYEIDPESVDSIREMKYEIYEETIYYEGIEQDLYKLREQKDTVETVRKNLLQAVYS
ncbi:hypothetical protein ACFQO4_02205 [Saliphagus sp. GCM10025334]